MSLATIKGVEIFAAGTYHKGTPEEVTFTEEDIAAMVRNAKTLSDGERPLHKPFVKVGKNDPHDQTLLVFEDGNPAAAWPTNIRKVGKRVLADWVNVQPSVFADLKAEKWKWCSAEIDKPDGEHPDFKVTGPVLKHLVLCNNPAVKGLYPIQHNMSAGAKRITHFCFTEFKGAAMSPERQEMLDYLASMGIDPAVLEALDDAALSAIASAFKAIKPDEAEMAEEGDPVLAGAGIVGSGGTAVAAKPPQLLPKSLTAKFAEMAGQIKGLTGLVATLSGKAKATTSMIDQSHTQAKRQLVHNFCEQAVKEGKLTPADVECDAEGKPLPQTVKARLLRADHTRTHTFSEAGKTVARTELEMQMAEIGARKAHAFSEKVAVQKKTDLYDKIRADVKAAHEAKAARPGKTLHEKLHLIPSGGLR